ncbi:CBO0543 family protein [Paenibacillus sp. BSR1-1]|uniref:CBO0543 family protein n=1 Tax=Paenibacillus sp. BSR1-1 TaxID=3020845 RepID=UPI00339DA4AC
MRIILYSAFIFAAYKWGDWKNWRKYYPTFLFWIGGDFFYNALLRNHRFWNFTKGIIGDDILHGHLIISLFVMFFSYTSTLLIYLGRFPHQRLKQLFWILLWVLIYTFIEISSNKLNSIEYHYGWNIYWSLLFNIIMFTVLKIHVSKPWLAWIISILFLIFLSNIFNLPRESFD